MSKPTRINSLSLSITVFAVACNVYDPDILDIPRDADVEYASDSSEDGSSSDGSGGSDSDGGNSDSGRPKNGRADGGGSDGVGSDSGGSNGGGSDGGRSEDSECTTDCVDPDSDGGADRTYRCKKITINSAYVDETLTNFPVLVNLSDDGELKKDTQHDKDIYFTDGDSTALLSFEVEYYNRRRGGLIAWVKIPDVSNSADTVFYMCYGDGADNWNTPNGYDETEVWSSDFAGVWHLAEDPSSGAVDAIKDSSSNANHGDPNNFTRDAREPGAIGQAIHFDGTDDHVRVDGDASLDLTMYVTLSTWFKTDSFDRTNYILVKRDGDNSQYGILTQSNGARFGAIGGSISIDDWLMATSDSTVATWHHAVVVIDSSASDYAKVYRDGREVASGDVTNPVSHPTVALFIGARGDGVGGTTYAYNGVIDEVRVSSVIRSPAWIKTEFENQRSGSTFLTIETE